MSKIYTRHGKKTCICGVYFLRLLEQEFKAAKLIKRDLSGLITQGGYNVGGVAASAGIHDEGGVFDLSKLLATNPAVAAKVVRIARECGAAAWRRRPDQASPRFPWGFHVHLVIIGCPHAAKGAAAQITDLRAGYNGLGGASRALDDGAKVPIRTWKQAYRANYRPVVKKLSLHRRVILTRATSFRKGPGRAWAAKGPRPKSYMTTIVATSGAWSKNSHGNWWPTKSLKEVKL